MFVPEAERKLNKKTGREIVPEKLEKTRTEKKKICVCGTSLAVGKRDKNTFGGLGRREGMVQLG